MKNVKAFNITAQGANHIKHNKVCQDSSLSFYGDEKISYAIVCDGHGGDDYIRSDVGSKKAATVAGRCIKYFVETVLMKYDLDHLQRHYEEILRGLASSVISQWREGIEEHFKNNPFTDDEWAVLSDKARKKYADGNIASAYGTTLIAVVFTDSYWFGIKVGDGKCVAISKTSEFSMHIPDDGICFLNATTSICDKNAIDNFRYAFSHERPAAVFIGTDGIDDCFNRDEQLFNLYKTTLYSFVTSDYDKAIYELTDYLPRLSAKGSGDDVSIGAVIDFDVSKKLDIIQNFDTTPKAVSEAEVKVNASDITKEPVTTAEIKNVEHKEEPFVSAEAKPPEENVANVEPVEKLYESADSSENPNRSSDGNNGATIESINFNNTLGTYMRVNNGRILKAVQSTTAINYFYSVDVNSGKGNNAPNNEGHKSNT